MQCTINRYEVYLIPLRKNEIWEKIWKERLEFRI